VLLVGRSPKSRPLCAYFKARSYSSGKNKTPQQLIFCAGANLIYVLFRPLQWTSGTDYSMISSGIICRETSPSISLSVRGRRMLECHVIDILVPVYPHENEVTLEFCLWLSMRLLLSLLQGNFFSCSSQCFARDAQNVLRMSPRNRFPG